MTRSFLPLALLPFAACASFPMGDVVTVLKTEDAAEIAAYKSACTGFESEQKCLDWAKEIAVREQVETHIMQVVAQIADGGTSDAGK